MLLTIVSDLYVSSNYRDKGSNGSVRYRLSEQTTTRYPGVFYVDSVSGQLKVMRSLDREMESIYEVGVVAYDLGQIISLSSEVCRKISLLQQSEFFYM